MITVAIIPRSLAHLEESLATASFAESIQIDVVDGTFDDNISWPYEPAGSALEASALISGRNVEIDLMAQDQEQGAEDWLAAGARRVVCHLEALLQPAAALTLQTLRGKAEAGLALSNDTPLELLHPYLGMIHFVQLMGIRDIGSQGQPFDERVIERIRTLRAQYPSLQISVDGGVNKETIVPLRDAGADRFVVGSAIMGADNPKRAYDELLALISCTVEFGSAAACA